MMIADSACALEAAFLTMRLSLFGSHDCSSSAAMHAHVHILKCCSKVSTSSAGMRQKSFTSSQAPKGGSLYGLSKAAMIGMTQQSVVHGMNDCFPFIMKTKIDHTTG